MDVNPADLIDEIRKEHEQIDFYSTPICASCGHAWPCAATRAAEAIDALLTALGVAESENNKLWHRHNVLAGERDAARREFARLKDDVRERQAC